MKRAYVLILALVTLLAVALFAVLVIQPQRERIEELDGEIAAEQQQQAVIQGEIDRLREVRRDAPEVEAEVAMADAIVPGDAALPAALRQLQLAADESGLRLQSVSTSRPNPVPDGPEGLSSIDATLQLEGGYFQLVDFLRRVEDPTIVPRGLTWRSLNLGRGDYPELTIGLTGRMYASISVPPPPEPIEEPDAESDAVDDLDDLEVEP